MAQIALVSQLCNNPLNTIEVLTPFIKRLPQLLPPSIYDGNLAGDTWVAIVSALDGLVSYLIGRQSEIGQAMLQLEVETLELIQQVYGNRWTSPQGRGGMIMTAQDLVWGYKLNSPMFGREALKRNVNTIIVRDDFDQFCTLVLDMMVAPLQFQIPEVASLVLTDITAIMQPYVSSWNEVRITKLVSHISEGLRPFASKHKTYLQMLLGNFGGSGISTELQVALNADSGDMTGIVDLVFPTDFIRVLRSRFAVNALRWYFERALDAPTLEVWFADGLAYLINLLAERKVINYSGRCLDTK